jgi:hypothetical protein
MIQRCPNCKSTFEVNGSLDFGAARIQVINCPVCSQDIWEASGLLPQRWSVGQVITREKVTTKPVITPAPTGKDAEPLTADITLPPVDAALALGRGVYNVGMWGVWMAGLLVIIIFKDEIKSVLREMK